MEQFKVCKSCNINKSFSDFGKDKKTKTGLHSYCKECCSIKNKEWVSKNKEQKEKYLRDYRIQNKDIIKEQRKTHRINNLDLYKERQEQNLIKNKEAIEQSKAGWREDNKNHLREYARLYRKNNQEWANANGALTRAKKIQASPPWLTKEHKKQITELYKEAKRLSKETGIKHEVDHIIPLLGKNVRGLHVPWNMRVITAEENRKKKNKENYNEA